MGLSRQARIITLLVIDTCFFFLELIVGYAVGSLALVADSFHMLNDVLSLIVALYTIKLATSPASNANSYGWQRAEVLGALINGVFLIALCVTIGLEAIGRCISPPEITNPKLIVLVGSLGLASNIVGLFLFHEHGHSHGGHSHGPIALPTESDEEAQTTTPGPRRARADSRSSLYQHPAETRAQIIEAARLGQSMDNDSFLGRSPPVHARMPSMSRRRTRTRVSRLSGVPGSNETFAPSSASAVEVPAAPGNADVAAAASPASSPADLTSPRAPSRTNTSTDAAEPAESPRHSQDISTAERGGVDAHGHNHSDGHAHDHADAHNHGDDNGHSHGKEAAGHSHGSGHMNMHGVFLHVLGDALGNVGVISTGLVIWFCKGRWTLYFDPGVSFLICIIIFNTAIPLVKSASIILLQGVPNHVSLEAVRESIKIIDGVVSVHELHVWQLSETTTVASVHVLIRPEVDYMEVANEIREALHAQGIHSVTIQPEFTDHDEPEDIAEQSCMIRCPPELCNTNTCCPPQLENVSEGDGSEAASTGGNGGAAATGDNTNANANGTTHTH